MMRFFRVLTVGMSIVSMYLVSSCKEEVKTGSEEPSATARPREPLFTLLSPQQTNIDFKNTLVEGPNTNILMYEYFYNGGGVAAGDVNNDGLTDIYFSSNMKNNKLYLNSGSMKFKDVTSVSGAEGRNGPWKTGVTMVDINGDNKLDLYLSYSGMVRDENRVNQLFINEGNDEKGIPHFSEKAKDYGLASAGYSNQAYFFDYDRDGDLDAILLNHNPKSLPVLNEVSTAEFLKKDDELIGIRLLKQSKGRFEDVTKKAGISGSALTYGLGVGVTDVNNDGWPDFYVSNDYAVPDYLYINNRNGTFTDKLQQSMGHNSQFSMGNDVADYNNDGWTDILTLDMLPEDNHRQKLLLSPDNYAKFELNLRTGFYYQYMRNMLQLNNGNGSFSEIGQLAGVSNTDWSWAALLADYDNDGWKDLFVTNGYVRDYTNLDFIKYMDDFVKAKGRLKRADVLELISHMPASNVVNYIFSNNKDLTFTNRTTDWGMSRPSNSNGAAYADLDNDGDLDIIVNNINQPAFIYQNESSNDPDNHYLQIKLQGEGLNTQGIGAKVTISSGEKKQHLEQMCTRGYLSSVSPILHFGLDKDLRVDSITIDWVSGKQQVLTNVDADRLLTLEEKNASSTRKNSIEPSKTIFKEVTSPVNYRRPRLVINDFKRQPLLLSQMSFTGPCLVKADVNGDALEDIYVGGGNGTAGLLFIQQKAGSFLRKAVAAFEADKQYVDADAAFFDANGDGYKDLYIASGGYHSFQIDDPLLQDRLYINDGKGNFTRQPDALPEMLVSKGCVAVDDANKDGHLDVFVGGRVIPGRYPETPVSYLLINDGHGKFTDQISSFAPSLQKLGMICDAVWVDVNKDQNKDLVVAGEWIPVSVFINEGNKLKDETTKYFGKTYTGWWNKISAGDFNNDNNTDLIVGNVGINTQFRASDSEPVEMYYKDFDNNGSVDPILCFYIQGKSFPYVTRDEMLEQIVSLRKRFTTFASYADVTLSDIFKPEELSGTGHLKVNHMETTLFTSDSTGKFTLTSLPVQAQYAPVNTITILDFNSDGNNDLLLCGNSSNTKIKTGKFDANYGVLLKGDGKGRFEYVDQKVSGLKVRGDVRSVVEINNVLLFGINEESPKAYRMNR
jgi:hypothetical protein